MAKPKMTATLAKYVMDDLTRTFSVRFSHPERMSQAEAARLLAAFTGSTTLRKAIAEASKTPVGKASIALYREVLQHFAVDHPVDANGGPAPFGRPAFAGSGDPGNPFRGMHPDDAAGVLAWADTQPEYMRVLRDKGHLQHAAMKEHRAQLHEAAYPDTPIDVPRPTPPAVPASSPAASVAPAARAAAPAASGSDSFQARLADLQSSPAYRSKKDPGHADAVARVSALYAEQYSGADAGAGAPPPVTSGGGGFAARLSALQSSAAYRSKKDPGHADALARVSALYAEQYPGADAADGATRQPAA